MIQIDSSAGLLYDPRLTDDVRRLYLVSAKMEMALNKSGALTVTIPEGNPRYSGLTQCTSELWVLNDGAEVFRGFVREIHEDINGLQEVVTEGLKGRLRDEQLRPYTKTTYGGTVAGWLQMAANTYNAQRQSAGVSFVPFSVGTVDEQALEIEAKDYGDILSAIDNSLIKAVGGYVFVNRVNGENVISWTKESGPIDEQPIAYGVNLTDYKRGDSAADTYTAVIPLGKNDGENGKLTIKSVNGGSDMLVDNTAAAERGLIVKKIDHNDIDDATALKNAGLADLEEAGRIAASVEASAVDLADAGWDVPRLRLGHRNPVQPARNSAVQLLPISRISVDLINPGSGRYTFSLEFKTLTQLQTQTAADAIHAGETAAGAATPESVAQQIAQAETKFADFVTDSGVSGIWTWRKWNSGLAECWGVSVCSIPANGMSTLGSLFSFDGQEAFPAGLFVSIPVQEISPQTGTRSFWVGLRNTAVSASSAAYAIITTSNSANAHTVKVGIHAIGRWQMEA